MVAINNRHAGGIVAAVFEATKAVEQNGSGFRATYVTNDSTHTKFCHQREMRANRTNLSKKVAAERER
jgi:hypothetical protein